MLLPMLLLSYTPSAAPPPVDDLRLTWGSRTYDIQNLSAGTTAELLTSMAAASRDVSRSYGTPSTWTLYPEDRREELSAAFQQLPSIRGRFDYGRTGASDPLAPIGPVLHDLFLGLLIVAGNDRQQDATWRAGLFCLIDRNQQWDLQTASRDYRPQRDWAWNSAVLDLFNAGRPVAVGVSLLLSERYAQTQIAPGAKLEDAAAGFRGASEWAKVGFDASKDPSEKAKIASQMTSLALAYGGRARDALLPSEKVLGPEAPFGRATVAYEAGAMWAERALDAWNTVPPAEREHLRRWGETMQTSFALAVYERERLRMELIDSGMIAEVAQVKPTGDDLALARRAFELESWYKWSLFGLMLELELELHQVDMKSARDNIQALAKMADSGASLRRAACDDVVNRARIYGFDGPSGSLQPELRQLARVYDCKLVPGAMKALGEDMP